MKKLILMTTLIMVLSGSFVGVTKATKGTTQASATVDVRVIIEDYCEVAFEDEGAMEVRLRYKEGAKGFGKKRVFVGANFAHNIETIVLDNPNDGIVLEKASGTTADRTDIAPGGKKYNVRVKATLEDKALIPSGDFVAGAVTVTVTKEF